MAEPNPTTTPGKEGVEEVSVRVGGEAEAEGEVRFQLVSDVHTEFDNFDPTKLELPALAPVLVLAGDIGWPGSATGYGYDRFVLDQAGRFELVLLVMGNHEYYGGEYFERLEAARELCGRAPRGNVRLLERSGLLVNGVLFVGCTLWSLVPKERREFIGLCLNDYHQITIGGPGPAAPRHLTVAETCAFHRTDAAWLEEQIAAARQQGRSVVVLTHHAPSERFGNPEDEPVKEAFQTNLERLLGPPVRIWGFGHTHLSSDAVLAGTRVVSNQVGYVAEAKRSGYRPDLVLSVSHSAPFPVAVAAEPQKPQASANAAAERNCSAM